MQQLLHHSGQTSEGRLGSNPADVVTWLPHTESCHLCSRASDGGRPRKRTKTTESVSKSVLCDLSLPKYLDHSLDVAYCLPHRTLQHLGCMSCSSIPTNEPVELNTCRHLHCKSCIVSACGEGSLVCGGCDNRPVKETELCAPSTLTRQLLEGLLVRCPKGCIEVVELKHLQSHLSSNCTHTTIPSPLSITVQQLLEQDHSNPSLMTSNTVGWLLEKILPTSGSIISTSKTPTGKVSTHSTNFTMDSPQSFCGSLYQWSE